MSENSHISKSDQDVPGVFSLFWGLLERRFFFVLIFICSSLAFSFNAAQHVAFGQLIDAINQAPEGADLSYYMGPIIWLLTFIALCHILYRVNQVFEIFSVQDTLAAIRHRLTGDALSRSTDFFTSERAGSIATRISTIPINYYQFFKFFQWNGFGSSSLVIFSIVTAFVFHPLLGLFLFIWSGLILAQNYYLLKHCIKPASYNLAETRGRFGGAMTDLVTNALLIIMHGKNKRFPKHFHESVHDEKQKFKRLRWFSILYQAAMGLSEIIFLCVMIFSGAYFLLQGSISTGEYVTVIMLSFRCTNAIWDISIELPGMVEAWSNLKENLNFLYRYAPQKDGGDALQLVQIPPAIRFYKINFRYGDDLPPVFEGFDLTIKAGEKIGVIGESGAGKTSLVSLLLRFYEPESGRILINDQPASEIGLASYRQLFSVIPQDTSLFHRSIRDNIRFGDENASEEAVIEAAKKAHAHDFIKDIKGGYDALVGDRGVKLSGGQRQRIAIARAFLRGAPVLVLDEATSALDSETEHLVQKALQDLMKDKTCFVIAHRLSTVAHLDRLILMEEGQIIAEGSHEDLLKSSEHYKNLWDLQTGTTIHSAGVFKTAAAE